MFGEVATGKEGRRVWCIGANVGNGAAVAIMTDSPLGAMGVRRPFVSFFGLPAGSGERPTTNFGVCALGR